MRPNRAPHAFRLTMPAFVIVITKVITPFEIVEGIEISYERVKPSTPIAFVKDIVGENFVDAAEMLKHVVHWVVVAADAANVPVFS